MRWYVFIYWRFSVYQRPAGNACSLQVVLTLTQVRDELRLRNSAQLNWDGTSRTKLVLDALSILSGSTIWKPVLNAICTKLKSNALNVGESRNCRRVHILQIGWLAASRGAVRP